MTDSLLWILGFLALGGVAAWVWFLVCNERTERQMTALLPAPGDPEFWARLREIEAVSYNAHLWRLATLRDPLKLYGPQTQAAVRGGKP